MPIKAIQPTPTYVDEDLERVVTRDYGTTALPEIKGILEFYGTESCQAEPLRVWMACLKLANGNIEHLKAHVETACADYRDVLASAEYSRYMRAESQEQQQQAIVADWQELQAWLQKT